LLNLLSLLESYAGPDVIPSSSTFMLRTFYLYVSHPVLKVLVL
jgi:hypothetical protein